MKASPDAVLPSISFHAGAMQAMLKQLDEKPKTETGIGLCQHGWRNLTSLQLEQHSRH